MKIIHPEPVNLERSAECTVVDLSIPVSHPYFKDHEVRGRPVLPGAVQMLIALESANARFGRISPLCVSDGFWLQPIVATRAVCRLRLFLFDQGDLIEFELHHAGVRCAGGTLSARSRQHVEHAVALESRDAIISASRETLSGEAVYKAFAEMGIGYGEYFKKITEVSISGSSAYAILQSHPQDYLTNANLLDCAQQSGVAISIGEHKDSLMPFSIGTMQWHVGDASCCRKAYVVTRKDSPYRTNLTVYNEQLRPLVSLFDLGVRASGPELAATGSG